MIPIDYSGITLPLKNEDGKTTVFDPIRKKWLVLTPEEQVRQYTIQYITQKLNYPSGRIAVEKTIQVGKLKKRFDIVIYDAMHLPWMLVECKAAEIPITETTLHQLLNYQAVVKSRFWLLTNGHQVFCADAKNADTINWLGSFPTYDF